MKATNQELVHSLQEQIGHTMQQQTEQMVHAVESALVAKRKTSKETSKVEAKVSDFSICKHLYLHDCLYIL